MKKVYVYNFKTETYELATKEEAKDLIGLIDSMNADCAASVCLCLENYTTDSKGNCSYCHKPKAKG